MNHPPLRILFVSHTYVVGVNQGKLDAIAKTGVAEVALLAPSNWKAVEWNRQLPLETPYENIKYYSAPVVSPGRGGAYIFAPGKIREVIKDFQPDLLHVELEVFSLCAFEFAIYSRLTGKPLVLFGWENQERRLPLPRHWIRKFVLDTAKLIIAGNQDGADLLRGWGYTGKVEVMPQLGVDTQLFSADLRSQHQTNELKIGFLGRLAHQKGIDLIFAAARQLQERGLKFRIILCGSGNDQEALREEAQKQQIAEFVTWQGAVPHSKAAEEISKFDVLVLPSRTTETWKEQFGHVLIEAMAMGVPVVGSSSGEIPNVIGRSDLVFTEENAVELAVILEKMICEPQWREEAGSYGMNRVYQYYTHEKIAERLINLWQELIETQSGGYMVTTEKLT
ncbi:glycosyltransferase [Calothrix sp. CCY 0018]|uniref:glycosyltransferase n=1 Tax=Calothrix sp. CCY 0018 TaxID=3103864 RepID=UPI0039C6CD72